MKSDGCGFFFFIFLCFLNSIFYFFFVILIKWFFFQFYCLIFYWFWIGHCNLFHFAFYKVIVLSKKCHENRCLQNCASYKCQHLFLLSYHLIENSKTNVFKPSEVHGLDHEFDELSYEAWVDSIYHCPKNIYYLEIF